MDYDKTIEKGAKEKLKRHRDTHLHTQESHKIPKQKAIIYKIECVIFFLCVYVCVL